MTVLAGRVADRLGKGIRGAPRDALIADWVPPEHRGYAYGVRQTMDNFGAVLGPLAAVLLLHLYEVSSRRLCGGPFYPPRFRQRLRLRCRGGRGRAPRTPAALPVASLGARALQCRILGADGDIAADAPARVSEAFMLLRATRSAWTSPGRRCCWW